MAWQQLFHVWIDFKTKKEISQRQYLGSSALKEKCSKSSSVCFLKQREKTIVANLFNISE